MINLVYHRPLQLAILGALWRDGQLALTQIERVVAREHKAVARSTVSTTLTRLLQQGLIAREQHRYRPLVTREQLIATVVEAIEGA